MSPHHGQLDAVRGGVLVVELAEQVVDESTCREWLADD